MEGLFLNAIIIKPFAVHKHRWSHNPLSRQQPIKSVSRIINRSDTKEVFRRPYHCNSIIISELIAEF